MHRYAHIEFSVEFSLQPKCNLRIYFAERKNMALRRFTERKNIDIFEYDRFALIFRFILAYIYKYVNLSISLRI